MSGVPLVTSEQAQLLRVWRSLRRRNPDQQPSQTELARELRRSKDAVCYMIGRLAEKGYFVKDDALKRRARCWQLTTEAAANPHLASMVQVMTQLVKIPAGAVSEAHREAFAVARSQAEVVLRDIVGQVGVLHERARVLRAEAQAKRARISAKTGG